MKSCRKVGFPANSTAGFSLLELLCVVAIMTMMLILVVPAMSSLLQSSNLTRGGQMMIDQLSLARQIASAKNRTVEVRLIKLNNTDGGYSGLQLWTLDSSGVATPAERITRLPNDIFISQTSLSPLLNDPPPAGLPSGTLTNGSAANSTYRAFKIRPTGTVEPVLSLAKRSDLYFTFVNGRFTNASSASAPANFLTVQINPDTGSPILYRP